MPEILSRYTKQDWFAPIRLSDSAIAFTRGDQRVFYYQGWHHNQGFVWVNRAGGFCMPANLSDGFAQETRIWVTDGWLLPDGMFIQCAPAGHERMATAIVYHNMNALSIPMRMTERIALGDEDDSTPVDSESLLLSCGWVQVRNAEVAEGSKTLTHAQAATIHRGYA